LLQSWKGGGLAAVGGGAGMTDGVLGGRHATTMLSLATWAAGTIFMVLALVLPIMSSRAQAPQSVIQVPTQAGQATPAPVIPGLGSDDVAPAPVEAPATDPPGN